MSIYNHIGKNQYFDIYKVYNSTKGEVEFPEQIEGAIGVTFDKHINGIVHKIVNFSAFISCFVNDIEDTIDGINTDLESASHAFVTLGKDNAAALKVGEAAGPGIIRNKICMGDSNWTSMFLFVPRDERIREQIVRNINLELTPPSKDEKTAQYPAISGFLASFNNFRENSLVSNNKRMAWALTDLIQNRSIRDATNSPKEGICSSVALRVLQCATLMSCIDESKIKKYAKLERRELCNKLLSKMNDKNHPLHLQIKKANFLSVNSGTTLPYQLYQFLMSEAEIDNKALLETDLVELNDEQLENIINFLEGEKKDEMNDFLEKVTLLLQKRKTFGHHSNEPAI